MTTATKNEGENRGDCEHDPLGDRVGGWRWWRCSHAGDTQTGEPAVELTAVDGIPVLDEVLGPSAPGRCLQELVRLIEGGGGFSRGQSLETHRSGYRA